MLISHAYCWWNWSYSHCEWERQEQKLSGELKLIQYGIISYGIIAGVVVCNLVITVVSNSSELQMSQFIYWHISCMDIAPLSFFFCPTPVWKTDVLCRGNVPPSVCPSARPSLRVFQTFLQHALRYQFETWYIHSVGGTTCGVWVASQLGHFDLVYSQK